MTQCALVVAFILKCSTFLAGPVIKFRSIRQSASFSLILLSDFLSSLYWPWDPLVILRVYSCLNLGPGTGIDCNMCRFSKLLLFSFFLP